MADNDIYDPDENAEPVAAEESPVEPLYQIYEGSRIAVGRATGDMWKKALDAALAAYEHVYTIWQECFKYYNNDQNRGTDSPVGVFKRGDGTENIVFSNLNIMLPAVYSKDPDITCSTTDEADQPFCDAFEELVNQLFKSRSKLNAKPKIKKAAGIGLLTNLGILKLDFTQKDDSREFAVAEMERITSEMAKAKTPQKMQELYGQLEAAEQNMEILLPSGFLLSNTLPHNLIIDPFAEQSDGMDAKWMMERVFLSTAALNARYTKKVEDEEDENAGSRVLKYKPTHKAVFSPGQAGDREDGLGLVLAEFDNAGNLPTAHTEDERHAYINMYYTECYYVWDKMTRRVLLFHRDDWKWPLWVWDDPLKISRFFPYFIISFSMSTGGTVAPGETAYILDQQDEVNDINRQKSRIRRTIFDYFFYNSSKINKDNAEKFVEAIRGNSAGQTSDEHLLGIDAGEMKISECIESVAPPSVQYEALFDKGPVLDSINRVTNTSDALRGTQFKTNTNVASVKSYEQSMRISVGAKVDVIEDVVADMATAIGEIAVQNWGQEEVAGMIGETLAQGWQEMDLATFNATYSVQVVAGSMEKPTSAFKKQEAIEVVQAVGQFADAAPATTLTIMLKVLEKAFTEVVIKPEDWGMMRQEIAMRAQAEQQQTAPPPEGGGDEMAQLKEAASKLPPEDQNKVIQMREAGASGDEIIAFVQQRTQELGAGSNGKAPNEPVRR